MFLSLSVSLLDYGNMKDFGEIFLEGWGVAEGLIDQISKVLAVPAILVNIIIVIMHNSNIA